MAENTQSILIADDDKNILKIFAKVLKKAGYTVETSTNGEEARMQASARVYDLVIMDLNMPGLSGIEAIETINSTNPEQRIIVFSAFTTDLALKDKLKKLNVVEIIQKPLTPNALLERVNAIIKDSA